MTDEPILTLYREWQVLFETEPRDDDHLTIIASRMHDLQTRICAMPCRTTQDFAAKLLAHTSHGGFYIEGEAGGMIWTEARNLVHDAPAVPDPLVEAGRALAAAFRAEEAADEAMIAALGSYDSLPALEAAHSAAQTHTAGLRKALGHHRATTLEGCLYQLAEASQIVMTLACSGRDGADAWVAEEEDRAQRCLYSVAAVLEGLTGQRLDPDMGMGALMPERLSPWRMEAEAAE